MNKKKTISIIFPCRNEEKIISPILSKVPNFINQIIVVDNRSTDKTAQIAKEKGATVFKEKRQINGIGYGFAIQTGIKKAKGDYIVLMDGDKTYPMVKIKKIIELMEKEDVDFISCKRFPLSNWQNMSIIRFIGGKMLTLFTNFLFKTNIEDVLSGMWVFKKSIVPYLNLEPGDWNLSLSIKISAATAYNINFFELLIPYKDRKIGASKQNLIKTGLSHFIYLLKLKYNYLLKPSYSVRKFAVSA